ncbi:hypothetical protein FCV67_23025 [Vibrio sp. F13]|nr:hypothetical protein FCV67_23025 [Vibrio sp. F13]
MWHTKLMVNKLRKNLCVLLNGKEKLLGIAVIKVLMNRQNEVLKIMPILKSLMKMTAARIG